MSAKRDLYEILGVARDTDHETLRKAYKKLARQTHPDLNPGDKAAEERFKDIARAWDVLGDAEKRRNYDEFGDVALEAGFDPDEARRSREAFGSRFGFRDQSGAAHGSEDFHFGDIDDLLGNLFGGSAEGQGLHLRGSDLEAGLELDFLDAVRGGEQRMTFTRPAAEGGAETLTVRIPPGVDTGGRLRIPGKGAPGIGGGPPGDLFVKLQIRPHPVFRRAGSNLELDLPISVREAILGARVEVPTLDGRATLTIPAGTHSGTRLRMRGKGVPHAGGEKSGDLLVRVQIRVPRDLDDEAKALLESLSAFEDPEIRKGLFS